MPRAAARCLTEVFSAAHDFISFDFGDFAIVVGYLGDGMHAVHAYFDDEYRKTFMVCWTIKIGSSAESLELSVQGFVKIKSVAYRWWKKHRIGDGGTLFNLLRKHFPNEMVHYCH